MLPSGLTPETTAATTPEARARDKINRDLFWLKDDSLLLSDDLSDSDPIAAEITRDLRSASLSACREFWWIWNLPKPLDSGRARPHAASEALLPK